MRGIARCLGVGVVCLSAGAWAAGQGPVAPAVVPDWSPPAGEAWPTIQPPPGPIEVPAVIPAAAPPAPAYLPPSVPLPAPQPVDGPRPGDVVVVPTAPYQPPAAPSARQNAVPPAPGPLQHGAGPPPLPPMVIPATPGLPPGQSPPGQSPPGQPPTGAAPGSGSAGGAGAGAPGVPGTPASSGGGGGSGSGGPAPPSRDVPMKGVWRDQLFFESEDRTFTLFIGGRAQFDVAEFAAPRTLRAAIPGPQPLDDGVTWRRLRLQVGGTFYRTIDYLIELDFFNAVETGGVPVPWENAPAPTDAWLTFREVPVVGNVRVGNHKPPISFEHLTSSRFLNFLERSPGFDAFAENFNNGFSPGISVFDTYADRRGTWAAGVYKNTRNVFGWGTGRNEAELTGRVTYLPVYEFGGRELVHVGLGATHRDAQDDVVRARSRFSVRNTPSTIAPLLADTGLLDARQQQVVVPELAVVRGPFTLQSEYYASWMQAAATPAGRGTAFFQSAYVEVLYFLTGEHREYDRERAIFTRVTPLRPMTWRRGCGVSGWGAWQVAARYSYLDLNSRGVEGGVAHDMTLGLNWFLNPNAKVQWNYILTHRNAAGTVGDGYIHGFGTRLAWDF
jgi:phosphate-selective porin OprO/OprP